jgi:hypothetical protein
VEFNLNDTDTGLKGKATTRYAAIVIIKDHGEDKIDLVNFYVKIEF